MPNFIGNGKAIGRVQALDQYSSSQSISSNCIICVDNADPGFDWIFTKNITGLVTKFGGANSHMAVRCAELGIPAAIGCGDQLFKRIIASNEVDLNCKEGYVRPNNAAY